jgi:hypothetical protein
MNEIGNYLMIFAKKFGRLPENIYFCRRKYQEGEDKL